ncbi:MAG: phosphoglycerate dehydrogenase [Acidimicrobiales bacterium]
MARILVSETIAEQGLDLLRSAGHEVDVRTTLSKEELLEAVVGAAALIIRSATKVTADVLEAGTSLVVVGRAGIGLDNVDVPAATRRGVMVVNAPESNVISAAEHTIALMLAEARNIPQAHSALVAGKWERNKWEGVELFGKTLGIVGLGRVGTLVAQRAGAFGMRLIAYDPFVAEARARQLGVELLPLADVVRQADFLTVHLPKTEETTGLVNAELLTLAKPDLRVINTARGEIVDEAAVAAAIAAGNLGGAAVDVFPVEPTTSSPLFSVEHVVVTPHLGASTKEAQDNAGVTIAEQVQLALEGELVPFAVNIDAAQVSESVKPFVALAERMARAWVGLAGGLGDGLEAQFRGGLAEEDTRVLSLAVLKGVLSVGSEEPVSYINAPQLAAQRGLAVRTVTSTDSPDYVNLITMRGAGHEVSGTTFLGREPRIVALDGHSIELPLARWMLVVHNDDRVGVVALVAGKLAAAGLNIVDLKLGRSTEGGTAIMALSFEEPVPPAVVRELRASEGVLDAVALSDI